MNRNFFREPLAEGGGGTSPDQEALRAEAYNGDILNPGYKVAEDGTISKEEAPIIETEGVDAEGNPIEGYEKLEDGTIQKIVVDNEEQEDDFIAAVEAITGETYDIDYGDIDPVSPEGIAKREEVIKEKAIENWENTLKESIPDAYAYFLHLQMGGTKEEFFSTSAPNVPAKDAFESSTDLQAQLLKSSFIEAGIPEDVAQATIDKYIKDNVLKEKAVAVYNKLEQTQADQVARLQKAQAEQDAQFQKEVSTVMGSIDSTINSDALNFVIPTNQKKEFSDFVKEKIRYADGGFMLAQPLTQENIKEVMGALFLQYSKNDLSKVVRKEARILTTQKLRLQVQKDNQSSKKSTENPESNEENLPLSYFMPRRQ